MTELRNPQTPDPVKLARKYEESGRRAMTRQADAIVGVGALFGGEVAQALTRRAEDVTENHGEAIWHLWRVVEDRDAQIRGLEVDRTRVIDSREELRQVAREALDLLIARYDRARKPLPDEIEDLLVRAQHPAAKEPF